MWIWLCRTESSNPDVLNNVNMALPNWIPEPSWTESCESSESESTELNHLNLTESAKGTRWNCATANAGGDVTERCLPPKVQGEIVQRLMREEVCGDVLHISSGWRNVRNRWLRCWLAQLVPPLFWGISRGISRGIRSAVTQSSVTGLVQQWVQSLFGTEALEELRLREEGHVCRSWWPPWLNAPIRSATSYRWSPLRPQQMISSKSSA